MLPVALVYVARVSVRSVSHLPGLKDKNQISITILACVNKKDGKFQNYSSFCFYVKVLYLRNILQNAPQNYSLITMKKYVTLPSCKIQEKNKNISIYTSMYLQFIYRVPNTANSSNDLGSPNNFFG